jgi:hypothetical protein
MTQQHTDHVDERELELYVLNSEVVKSRRADIRRHLKSCAWCSGLHRRIVEYYRSIGELESQRAALTSHALSVPHRALRVRPTEDVWTARPGAFTFPQRVAASFRTHPFRWSAGIVTVMAALVLLIPRLTVSDTNPAYAKPEKDFMVVYNRHGEELWRKHIGSGIDLETLPSYVAEQQSQGFPVVDIDGDGRNEIFAVFGWANWRVQGNPLLRTMICFKADGSERWRYELHRNISIGNIPFSDDYRFYQMVVNDFDKDGKYEVIAFATHIPWFPNVIVKLDAQNGSLLGEYWHNGMPGWIDHKDIDGDGVEELFMGGQNNRLQQASLAVLDPREIRGQAPSPPEFTVDGISPGRERYYILFPASDLKPAWVDITNEVTGVTWKSDSTLEIVVSEKIRSPHSDVESSQPHEGGTLYFYFDRSMRCVRVRASDAFSATRAKYERLGTVKGHIDHAYLERLRQGVRYWDGETFVDEPVMNKRYRGAVVSSK